jgi:phage terminase small subunit
LPRRVKISKDLRPGEPAKPVGLSERASSAWDRLIRELADSAISPCPAHRAYLELAATIEADMVDCSARVKKDGQYIETKAGLVAHPASKRLDALRRDYMKILSLIGLRAAVAVPEDADESLDDMVGE